jgi:predicted dehydrogenase
MGRNAQAEAERTIRWGVLSTARIGLNSVIPAIQGSSGQTVVAIGSRHLPTARRCAEPLGIPRAYGSYREVLEDDEVEAVYIPLPNSLHLEWTLRAAEAGKHVLCEKPVGLTGTEAKRMREVCGAHDVLLMEAFMYRHHPQWTRVHHLIREGFIGAPKLVRASFSAGHHTPPNIRLDPELGGGALYDIGCYAVNACRFVFGAEPRLASARMRTLPGFGVDALTVGTLDFGDGRFGQIDCGFDTVRREQVEIVGDRGTLQVLRAFGPGTSAAHLSISVEGTTLTEWIGGANQSELETLHFCDCLRQGTGLAPPAEDGVRNMRVLDALFTAAREGRAVPVAGD